MLARPEDTGFWGGGDAGGLPAARAAPLVTLFFLSFFRAYYGLGARLRDVHV